MSTLSDPATFPILDHLCFLNHAAVAPISGPAAAALRTYAQQAETTAYTAGKWYKRVGEIRATAARLIGADAAEVAFVANTTSGIAMVANGLAWEAGDEVVITNVEYPANRYPWEALVRSRGVRLVEVAQRDDGRIAVEDVLAAIGPRTRVVSLSHVQFASGHRIDLKPIADAVHAVGGYLNVDAIQSVGLLPVDVRALGIDFLSADGHKWMLGPEGAGIFYGRRDLIGELQPTVAGWMCMVDAANYGAYRFEYLNDARRFEPGTWNIPGILALGASLDLLLDVGIDQVWQRVEALNAQAHTGLERLGYRVFSPRAHAEERSGILIFDAPQEGRSHLEIVNHLQRQGIVIALREGRLRISPHYYNTAEQIERMLGVIADF